MIKRMAAMAKLAIGNAARRMPLLNTLLANSSAATAAVIPRKKLVLMAPKTSRKKMMPSEPRAAPTRSAP